MEKMKCPMKSDLLNELECPVCLEYLMPPIVFCLNGHNVCPRCRPKLKVCPNCRQPFVNIRNIALEKMSRQIEYPCIYRRSGCMEIITFDLKQQHEKMCTFNKHNCPLSKVIISLTISLFLSNNISVCFLTNCIYRLWSHITK